jgi:hypothetical protein
MVKCISRAIYSCLLPAGYYPAEVTNLDGGESNCRYATRTEQLQNRVGWGEHAYKGVTYIPARPGRGAAHYRAQITVDGKRIYPGERKTAAEAARLYDAAALKYFGESAYLNFPDHPVPVVIAA